MDCCGCDDLIISCVVVLDYYIVCSGLVCVFSWWGWVGFLCFDLVWLLGLYCCLLVVLVCGFFIASFVVFVLRGVGWWVCVLLFVVCLLVG